MATFTLLTIGKWYKTLQMHTNVAFHMDHTQIGNAYPAISSALPKNTLFSP